MRDAGGSNAARVGGAAVLGAVAVAALAIVTAVAFQGRDAFWLDESWTGAIVSERTWAGFAHQVYWDVNAPLYYLLERLWSAVFGLSDAALRAPSLIACAVTPILIVAGAPRLPMGARLAWAAGLAWWFPGLCFAQEARCYALLLLASTAQTLAYMRLFERPDTRRAAVWTGCACLAILLHYDALYLGAAQGLFYVLAQPRRAVRTWPALLALAPAAGWMALHAPRIAQFARPGIAWYSTLTWRQALPVVHYLAGDPLMLELLGAAGLNALLLRLVVRPRRGGDVVSAGAREAAWAAGAAALSVLALVAVGVFRPSFTYRYLTPGAPGLVLGVVLVLRWLSGRRAAPIALAALAAAYLGSSVWTLGEGRRMAPRRYNFERASQALVADRPARLVFAWDHPVQPVLHGEQLAALGGFFLHRQGVATQVVPVRVSPRGDANLTLARAAGPGRADILWLYDTVVQGTAAVSHPPALEAVDPSLSCRQYGRGRFGVVACGRRADPPATGRPRTALAR